ncbi:MAG: hypothetical protein WAO56_00160 [Miniphocaeibacter sp.]|uniref:hypothetical protein n=1 Tax=Miniphocaeibacter sp. TaxID=3100973 RepID=UPI001801D535|nr:hypothetical protein [Gallicola sp.]
MKKIMGIIGSVLGILIGIHFIYSATKLSNRFDSILLLIMATYFIIYHVGVLKRSLDL